MNYDDGKTFVGYRTRVINVTLVESLCTQRKVMCNMTHNNMSFKIHEIISAQYLTAFLDVRIREIRHWTEETRSIISKYYTLEKVGSFFLTNYQSQVQFEVFVRNTFPMEIWKHIPWANKYLSSFVGNIYTDTTWSHTELVSYDTDLHHWLKAGGLFY